MNGMRLAVPGGRKKAIPFYRIPSPPTGRAVG